MNQTPVLEGYGVRLEPMAQQHVEGLTRIAIEPSNWKHMNLRIETPADVQKLVDDSERAAETGTVMPWVTTVDGEVVGATSYLDLNRPHRTVEIGFTWLARNWRGAGVNPRVKLLQLQFGVETIHFRRIALKTHHENLHSQRALLKLGAQFEGTFRNHMIMPDGSTRHTKWYSITEEDWPAIKASLLARIATEPIRKPA
ncbi:acetyltransferase, ribosomal protein N-acetylase [Terriglobus roseus DSM 18391]|uniref:Acetyltransferase, ribosomal protein N-acetylase n=1 Tax=Terriglobus roseus (strain DSM 18391 / NRRL B-41598 / KBS 63) TaxID=926566 RepID=I3ZER4_TERRK|nr:GNAT family protein [Terriglobus roseus]AFL87732.1 acetyltransferase, ribosomal protein N-acetylase [Terriglobus roseus DSM 18391]